jgi:hypothetical protein
LLARLSTNKLAPSVAAAQSISSPRARRPNDATSTFPRSGAAGFGSPVVGMLSA